MIKENQINIPDGWHKSEIKTVIEEKAKSSIKVSDATNYGGFPFFTSGEGILLHDTKIIEGENLFLATGGVANIKYYNGDAAYSTDTFAVAAKPDTITQYLYYYLLSNINYINKNYFEGSGLKHLQKKDFRDHSFLLPSSTIEQQKIATILSKLDEAIAQTEQLIEKYKRIKEGLMNDLLTRGIDEQGNIRSEKTHKFKDSELGRIPEEWEVVSLGELIDAVDPQPDHRTPAEVDNGIPYLGISDFITHKIFDTKKCRRVGAEVLTKQQKSFKVENGDLIFGKIGTIGKPTILPAFDENNFALSANVILIKPYECASFIYWSMEANYVTEQVKVATHSTSQPAFGIQKIRELSILCPQPEERNTITNKLDKIETVLNETIEQLQKLKLQKSGLMHDLLTGKVRVKM